jgi:menaquinone-dependent protoporphyrinogen IX oxidase
MNTLIQKVLVTFSDNYGYVSEIVDIMSRKLRDLGLTVDIVDLERTKENQWPSIDEYAGLMVISSGDAYHFWNKKARRFATFHVGPYKKEQIIGFFSSDPWSYSILIDPVKAKESLGKVILKICDFIPDFYENFGPVLDFSRNSKLKHPDRRRLKDAARIVKRKTGLEFEYHGINDFRDWNRIEEICNEFAEILQKGKLCPSCASVIPKGAEFCTNCGEKL